MNELNMNNSIGSSRKRWFVLTLTILSCPVLYAYDPEAGDDTVMVAGYQASDDTSSQSEIHSSHQSDQLSLPRRLNRILPCLIDDERDSCCENCCMFTVKIVCYSAAIFFVGGTLYAIIQGRSC